MLEHERHEAQKIERKNVRVTIRKLTELTLVPNGYQRTRKYDVIMPAKKRVKSQTTKTANAEPEKKESSCFLKPHRICC
jgi:hypothetical protein